MSTSEPKRIGVSFEVKPHAYDPATNPELFEGVLARRVIAFIDRSHRSWPSRCVFLAMFIFVVGVVTLGLGFFLYALLWPAMVIWALFYYGITLGGPHSATLGMRVMDLRNAHLVRRAGLFRARRGACRACSGSRFRC